MNARTSRALRILRRLVRLAWLAAMVVVLFTGVARAGSTYFVCSVMDEQRAEPCCRKQTNETPAIEAADCDCCHAETIGKSPPGTPFHSPRIAPAPVLAALAPRTVGATSASNAVDRPQVMRSPPPSGPPPSARHARLMVFLN